MTNLEFWLIFFFVTGVIVFVPLLAFVIFWISERIGNSTGYFDLLKVPVSAAFSFLAYVYIMLSLYSEILNK